MEEAAAMAVEAVVGEEAPPPDLALPKSNRVQAHDRGVLATSPAAASPLVGVVQMIV